MGDMTEPITCIDRTVANHHGPGCRCVAAGEPNAYPGYATPTLVEASGRWFVTAAPWGDNVGFIESRGAVGCVAFTMRGHYVGLYPDQQAAGEALVKHAGYEVLR